MFKKISLTVVLTLALVLFIAGMASASENYIYGSFGHNDSMFNFSGAMRFGHYGVELGLGGRSYPGMLDYACPHTDYTIINDHYDSLLLGVDLIRYFDLGESCSIYVGAGVYLLGYEVLSQSNATGWVYREYTGAEGSFAYSYGLQFHQDEGFGIGAGYHSLRGYNLQMIFKM